VDKRFTSDELPLAQLLDQARKGELQLPDFQRGWVWADEGITSLLASVSLSYPIGAVMTLQTGNPDVKFRPRTLEGVELTKETEPEFLLLDGQQRTTSLYLVLKSGRAVATRDAKGKPLSRIYYVDMLKSLDPDADREDAILSVPADGVVKAFGKEVILDVSSNQLEFDNRMFPLSIVLDQSATMDWCMSFLEQGPGDKDDRMLLWKAFNSAIINSFVQYQVPTIELHRETPKEAVCAVFEKVNTGGVSLTVFELLTATYAADDFNLRDDWQDRSAHLASHDVLSKFAATDFLQVVTLLATHDRRRRALADGSPSAPAVTCKRKDVLRLTLQDYTTWADPASKALDRIVPFLHAEHIYTGRDVPYSTQLVPLAAVFAVLKDEAESFGVREHLRQWLWCGIFGEMYGGSTETRFAMDLQDLVAWVEDPEIEPRTIRDAQFQAERLVQLRSRQSAAYKGLYALQMKHGGRDFRTGNTIDIHAYVDDAIDIHHIFPQAWCKKAGVDDLLTDSVVNKTAIDAHTNRRIGGKAPSAYLEDIQVSDKIEEAELDAILRSHDIDPAALRDNDFPSFFARRFERLLKQIEQAMGKPVNRAPDGQDNPFAGDKTTADPVAAIQTIIKQGESKLVEFKSSGRHNLHTGDKDPAIEWSLLKTLAAFTNSYGGTLLVGVADDGSIKGLEHDLPYVQKNDLDGWLLWLTGAVTKCLGKVVAADLDVTLAEIDGLTVARVDTGPSATPVFASKEGKPMFMVRLNNSTVELAGQEALDYQKQRWP
jgi:hypothetical protein